MFEPTWRVCPWCDELYLDGEDSSCCEECWKWRGAKVALELEHEFERLLAERDS